MPVRDTPWPAGYPCWVDLMTTNADAARRFYEDLFAWKLEVGSPDTGGYTMAIVDAHPAAGIGEIQPGQQFPPSWTTYLASADADATGARISAAGGTILAPVMDVLDLGRMLIAADPTGGVFGVWQPLSFPGAGITGEPNTLVWNELMTRDIEAAKDFYAAVFGYLFTDVGEPGQEYVMLEIDGRPVGGIGTLPPAVPEQVPAHWRVYFAVDDCDALVERARTLGATVLRAPEDMPYGRFADLADAQDATFSVITPATPT